MALRPILKPLPHSYNYNDSPLPFASTSHIPPLDSPHVHFPPTPVMTKISITHSAFSYDRAPIEVVKNVCALPERGERKVGVVKGGGEGGGYFHPRVGRTRERFGSDPSCGYPQANSEPSERDGNTVWSYLSSSSSTNGVTPPLVFEHSSSDSSDSDLGGSPVSLDGGEFEVMGDHEPTRVVSESVHLCGSGFSIGPSISTTAGVSGIHREEGHGLGPSNSGVSGKKSRSHRHAHAHAHSKRDANEAMLGGMDLSNRSRGRTKRFGSTGDISDTYRSGASGFSSSFCDPGLEGCLGGF